MCRTFPGSPTFVTTKPRKQTATACTEMRKNVFQEQGATLCEANGRVVESISGTNELLSPRRQRRLESEQIQFKKVIQQRQHSSILDSLQEEDFLYFLYKVQ